MYDFAKRPLWILSHVLVLLAVVAMIRLAFWQMDRWHEEQGSLDQIEAGLVADPVPLQDLALPASPDAVDESLRYLRVTATGTWDTDDEVVIRNRSQQGQPGGWLLTPLVQDDGTAVAVVRGWVPLDVANRGRPFSEAAPPPGEATVVGVVGLTQPGGGIGPVDPEQGELDSLARVDIDRFAQQLDVPLDPLWLTLESSEPPQISDATGQQGSTPGTSVLVPVEIELPSPSQNFSYMIQWWCFAAIAAVGYVLILRKVAHGRAGVSPRSAVPVSDDPQSVDV